MTDIDWTPALVEARLIEAADTMKRLPPVKVQGYFNTWPVVRPEFTDLVGREAEQLRLGPPSAAAISRMDEALEWLHWLAPEDAKLVWMRAEEKPWKTVCRCFGIGRSTANRRLEYALNVIVWRLWGRPVPATWSARFVAQRVEFVSSEK
jgi:hypothetical protein